jgi:A/G-specific adenine glycosylase
VKEAATVPPAHAAALRRRLLAWWRAARRDLPWRLPPGASDPYRTWISEVMLQQTRVATVIPYYRRFLERWPTLEALAAASLEEVLGAWSGLGYYARGRHLHAAARQAWARHGGLPATPEGLRALPGFGPYTVGAVSSIAFGVAEPAVDGNAIRVLARLFAVEGDARAGAPRARVEALARALVPRRRPGDWNQALMELGATRCRPRDPECHRCPLAGACRAHLEGRTAELPARRRRARPRRVEMALARVERGGRLLLVRRDGEGLLGGTWQMPGVEVPAGVDPAEALRPVLRSLGIRAAPGPEVACVERELSHRRLFLRVLRCPPPRGRAPITPGRVRWTGPGDLTRIPLSTAMRRAIEASERA